MANPCLNLISRCLLIFAWIHNWWNSWLIWYIASTRCMRVALVLVWIFMRSCIMMGSYLTCSLLMIFSDLIFFIFISINCLFTNSFFISVTAYILLSFRCWSHTSSLCYFKWSYTLLMILIVFILQEICPS